MVITFNLRQLETDIHYVGLPISHQNQNHYFSIKYGWLLQVAE